MSPVSPCRTWHLRSGLASTNPCADMVPTVADASTRVVDTSKSLFRSAPQPTPTPLDMRLCGQACEAVQPPPATSPLPASSCQARASPMGIISTTPCNRFTDASARTPEARASSTAWVAPYGVASPASAGETHKAMRQPNFFAPPEPTASFSGAAAPIFMEQPKHGIHGTVLAPNACAGSTAGIVVADEFSSWLQSSGLPSGSAALEAQLRAAAPASYED